MNEMDFIVWTFTSIGIVGALTCAGYAFRLHDSIWHHQRKWAPHLGLASLLLFGAFLAGIAALLQND